MKYEIISFNINRDKLSQEQYDKMLAYLKELMPDDEEVHAVAYDYFPERSNGWSGLAVSIPDEEEEV